MKTLKLSKSVKSFFTGTLFGIILISSLSFFPQDKLPPSAAIITTSQANNYLKAYLLRPFSNVVPPKGVAIDMDQYTTMGILKAANPNVVAFKIYYGIDENNTNVGIVLGMDVNGKDITNGSASGKVYSVTSKKLAPCPPICDAQSPIQGN